jgi:hypothetical protein
MMNESENVWKVWLSLNSCKVGKQLHNMKWAVSMDVQSEK